MTVNCIAGRGTGTRGESRESVSERRRERTGLYGPYVIALFASLLCYFAWRVALAGLALGPSGAGRVFLFWLCHAPVVIFYMRFTTVSTRQTSPALAGRDSWLRRRGARAAARFAVSVRVGGASAPRPAPLGGRVLFVAGPRGCAGPRPTRRDRVT
jgi:hypothetical protein